MGESMVGITVTGVKFDNAPGFDVPFVDDLGKNCSISH